MTETHSVSDYLFSNDYHLVVVQRKLSEYFAWEIKIIQSLNYLFVLKYAQKYSVTVSTWRNAIYYPGVGHTQMIQGREYLQQSVFSEYRKTSYLRGFLCLQQILISPGSIRAPLNSVQGSHRRGRLEALKQMPTLLLPQHKRETDAPKFQ